MTREANERCAPAAAAASATRGVRRRREDASVEIEELDSATMRQSAYNYFQRKRRRTLAEYLDGLSLAGGGGAADAAMTADDEGDAEYDGSGDERGGGGRRRRHGARELTLFGSGGGGAMKQFFFGSGRRRPMDRVFRHYAAVANHTCVPRCMRQAACTSGILCVGADCCIGLVRVCVSVWMSVCM